MSSMIKPIHLKMDGAHVLPCTLGLWHRPCSLSDGTSLSYPWPHILIPHLGSFSQHLNIRILFQRQLILWRPSLTPLINLSPVWMFLLGSGRLLLDKTCIIYHYFHLSCYWLMLDSLLNKLHFLKFHMTNILIFLKISTQLSPLKEAFQTSTKI